MIFISGLILFAVPAHAQQMGAMGSVASAASPAGPMLTRIAPNAPLPQINVSAGQEQVAPDAQSFSADGHVVVTGGREFLLEADHVSGDLTSGVTSASGHLYLRELNTAIAGSAANFNIKHDLGLFTNATVNQGQLFISADHITIYPTREVATNARFSTCPPTRSQDYHIQARTLVYEETTGRLTAIAAAIYLGRARLAYLPYLSLQVVQQGHAQTLTQVIRQQFGYNRYDGAYLGLGVSPQLLGLPISIRVILPTHGPVEARANTLIPIIHPRARSKKNPAAKPSSIALLRQFAEGRAPLLPPGDPLLFHNFGVPSPFDQMLSSYGNSPTLNAEPAVSYKERIFGKSVSNLNLSRLPEVGFIGYVPIAGRQTLPATGNPQDVRHALRQIALRLSLSPQFGYYEEYPDDVHRSRDALAMSLAARPLLVAPDTLIIPRLGLQSNIYSGRYSYHYLQYDLAVERFFTDRDAVGLEYIKSEVGGESPFIFDRLDTSNELDLRGQIGNNHHILNILLRYDLNGHDLFDWDLTYGHVLHCLVPTINYDNRSHNIGFGLNVEGFTF